MYETITHCRICGNADLAVVVDLGEQAFTGIFPVSCEQTVPVGPLHLVRCCGEGCGFVQLRHVFPKDILYTRNYGYRSNLNKTMVEHLAHVVNCYKPFVNLSFGDVVIDIGANDGTLLNHYDVPGLVRVAVDPLCEDLAHYYENATITVPTFFSRDVVTKAIDTQAKVITSIAVLYDVEDPLCFARDINALLDDEGVWICEVSYLPHVVSHCAYDSICHEHVSYFSCTQLVRLCEQAGFRILEVSMNEVNGGSIIFVAAKSNSVLASKHAYDVAQIIKQESRDGVNSIKLYQDFGKRIEEHRRLLRAMLHTLKKKGNLIFGYGASTKGNVLLQYCGFSPSEIACIAEVNTAKFGCVTPGTHIPIISEAEAHEKEPGYFLILPWHFSDFILEKEQSFRDQGGRFIVPLPEVRIV